MTRVSHTAPKRTKLKAATEDMKTRKSNSGVQSGRRKRAGRKRSSEPAPTSKHPRRHPVEATEQQCSSRPLTTEDIPELVKAVVEAMPSQPASASETARSVAPPPGRSVTFTEDSTHQPPQNRDEEQLDIGEHSKYGDCIYFFCRQYYLSLASQLLLCRG